MSSAPHRPTDDELRALLGDIESDRAERKESLKGDAARGRVAPGRCLPGAPTDPDVQISRIRLFETRLRYAPAIRSSCVEMGSEPDVSSIFPSHGSMSRRTLRSTGSLWLGSPASSLLWRAPTSRPPRSASLALASTVPSFDGADGNSQVPRRPSPRVLRLFDPGGISGAGLRDNVPTCRSFDVAFRAYGLVGFHHLDISGPDSAACVLAVYASRLGSPRTSRKTRFRLAALPWSGGSSTRWVATSGFSFVWTHMASS